MEQNRQKGVVPGVILIGLGILFLLRNYNINIRDWFLLGIGIAFIIAYFIKKKAGFLITGLILSYFGSLIFLNSTRLIKQQTFGSLVLVALGLAFLTVYFAKKKTGFIFPGFILPAIGIYNYIMGMNFIEQSEIWPLIFMTLATAFLLIFIFEFRTLGYKPLVTSLILFGIGLLSFMTIRGIIEKQMWINVLYWLRYFWPVLLIIAGVLVILKNLSIKK
ncbi:MAG: hypothetical protein PWP27_372 [Clostridiales bacterium]|jgi:hypothetical protein|nr:hypothetical protein [Clostridiales bacterium]